MPISNQGCHRAFQGHLAHVGHILHNYWYLFNQHAMIKSWEEAGF